MTHRKVLVGQKACPGFFDFLFHWQKETAAGKADRANCANRKGGDDHVLKVRAPAGRGIIIIHILEVPAGALSRLNNQVEREVIYPKTYD